jgi:hypothetical protein
MSFLQPDIEWDQLHQFFGCYLNQDWRVEYETVNDAVVDAAPDFDHHLLNEFDRVRALQLDDDGYQRMLLECGCALDPEAFGMRPSEFWTWVEQLMRSELASRPTRREP